MNVTMTETQFKHILNEAFANVTFGKARRHAAYVGAKKRNSLTKQAQKEEYKPSKEMIAIAKEIAKNYGIKGKAKFQETMDITIIMLPAKIEDSYMNLRLAADRVARKYGKSCFNVKVSPDMTRIEIK